MSSHLRTSNHYYLLTLLGHYTRESHPDYLSAEAYAKLSKPGVFDSLRIHTDELREVLSRLTPGTLTIAVVMDSLDWFEHGRRAGREGAASQIRLLHQALVEGGRVLVRSAGVWPWYIATFEVNGFAARRVAVRREGSCLDRCVGTLKPTTPS
jgi:betaine lipid synthase